MRGQEEPSLLSDILMKHIGDHVKSLSLIALPTTGAEGAASVQVQDSQKRQGNTNSSPRPPSGAEGSLARSMLPLFSDFADDEVGTLMPSASMYTEEAVDDTEIFEGRSVWEFDDEGSFGILP